MTSSQPSLTEALADLGISHTRTTNTVGTGRHLWTDEAGAALGEFDAHEGWAEVARLRSIREAA